MKALDEASQTAYVRGQWVYADTGHNGLYRIAGAVLPGTGDMAAYQLCGKSCKHSQISFCILNDSVRTVDQANKTGDNEMLRHFKVALSHVTQLTHLLAFYFGVRLPKKVAHLDFIRSDLDAKRFAGRVGRLHANVLFLCTSQGVAPDHLRHANPLARISTLLETNICDLGRYNCFVYQLKQHYSSFYPTEPVLLNSLRNCGLSRKPAKKTDAPFLRLPKAKMTVT